MPYLDLDESLPGITGLMARRPDTAAPLNRLAEVLLREPAALSRGERELNAAYLSHLNETRFYAGTHGATAAQLNGRPRKTPGWETPAGRLHKLLAA